LYVENFVNFFRARLVRNIFSAYSTTTMAGGLMQLVAYGAQDVFLTGSPKVTFFQAVYKRHTNFAMENIEQTLNGSVTNDGRVSVTIARNGDLVGDMYIEMTTKALAGFAGDLSAVDPCWVAERAVKDIELSIGGQRIDKHYQMWWRLYSELYLDESKKANWGKMTSSANGAANSKVFLPLVFFFNRNAGLYLPLIALQYHEVRLDIDLAARFDSYLQTSGFKVWANYVYLDTEERRRFAQKGHEYLIEQVQHTGTDTVDVGTTKQVRLSYNHPVKELVWAFNNGTASNAHMWNFTSNAGTSNAVVLATDLYTACAGNTCVSSTTLNGAPQLLTAGVDFGSAARWAEEGAASATNSVGPLETFKLVLNGQDRFKEQSGKYFNQVQPMQHHSGSPYPGIYSYSFALKPEEHQPSGTCNFSRIDNAQVAVTLKAATQDCTTLNMFATNYNVLRIQSGMGGLAFSN
jgi:hypothetical protein